MSEIAFGVRYGALDLTAFPYGIEFGSDWGAPQSVSAELASLLTDGEVQVWQRDSNRTITFTVVIEWSDMRAAAQAEARLDAEVSKQRNELLVDPGDGIGAKHVYDTFRAQKVWLRDDETEQTGYRRFSITMQAAPTVRAVEETVVEAVTDGEPLPDLVEEQVDNCSSTTGWTALGDPSYGTSIAAVSGQIRVVNGGDNNYPYGLSIGARRTGVVDLSETPYLIIDAAPRQGTPRWSAAELQGARRPIATGPSPDFPGCTRLYFRPGVPSLSVIDLDVPMLPDSPTQLQSFAIENVATTNWPPFLGTGRQQFRSLTVDGPSRTQGSLQIAHETLALGEVLVYTNADDGSAYQPACRQYRVSGNASPSPDPTAASGAIEPLDGGARVTYDIPANALPPGTYAVAARLRAAASGFPAVGVRASTRVGTNNLLTETNVTIVGLNAAAWSIQSLGSTTLPPVALPAQSDGFVRMEVWSSSDIDIDELYLFNLTIGALSFVLCGTGTPAPGGPANRLWLDTATLDRSQPSVWLGTEADGSDRRHAIGDAEVRSLGIHTFPPGDINLFTVASNAPNAAASLRYYERGPNNVGR